MRNIQYGLNMGDPWGLTMHSPSVPSNYPYEDIYIGENFNIGSIVMGDPWYMYDFPMVLSI